MKNQEKEISVYFRKRGKIFKKILAKKIPKDSSVNLIERDG